MSFRACAVIPVFDHEHALPLVVQALRQRALPCVLVDDASSPACAQVMDELATQPDIHLLRLPVNQGKGGAVMAGLAEAQAYPDALICGYPQFDDSVPKGRLYARYLTHVWVWINSLSLEIRDSMCGFRVYPLAPTLAVIRAGGLGKRMDFDPEILVRLAWREQPMRWRPTRVHYPLDGRSHFRLWQDNVLISRMHTRLFFGMLLRAPRLLWRRVRG